MMNDKNSFWLMLLLIIAMFGFSGCVNSGAKTDSSSTSSQSTSSNATTSTTSSPSISYFYPSAGTYSTLPTTIEVQFSESAMNSSAVTSTSNWIFTCTSRTYYPTNVQYSGGVAYIYLPTLSSVNHGDTCTLSASSSIVDSRGYSLSGSAAASYVYSGSGTSVSGFSPAAGTYASLPSQVQVTFTNASLGQNSVTDIYDWTYSCPNQTYYPTSVTVSNNVATVNLPSVSSLNTSDTCTLSLSSSITDANGYSVSGTLSAAYVYNGSGTGKMTGYISSPTNGDRVYGPVTLSAYAYITGEGSASISAVKFYLDGIFIGKSTSNPFTISFNSQAYPNGTHTVSMAMIDSSGNSTSASSTISVDIENHSYSVTSSAGGSGGTSFNDSASSGYNLDSMQVATDGSSVIGVRPIWETAFGGEMNTVQGASHGGSGGSVYALSCPSSGNYRVKGVFGTVGADSCSWWQIFGCSNPTVIRNIGLICGSQNGQSQDVNVAAVGSTNTSFQSFSLSCSSGKFVTAVLGASGSALDQIQLGCQ